MCLAVFIGFFLCMRGKQWREDNAWSCAVLHLKKDVTFARLLGWDKGSVVNVAAAEVRRPSFVYQNGLCLLGHSPFSYLQNPKKDLRANVQMHVMQAQQDPSEPSETSSDISTKRRRFLKRFQKTKKSLATREKLTVSHFCKVDNLCLIQEELPDSLTWPQHQFEFEKTSQVWCEAYNSLTWLGIGQARVWRRHCSRCFWQRIWCSQWARAGRITCNVSLLIHSQKSHCCLWFLFISKAGLALFEQFSLNCV